jgi:hypothetical protein
MNEKCCLHGPCRGVIRKTIGETKSVLWESVKKRDSWKRDGREPPSRNDLSSETEESAMLETVTRGRLVKTQKAGKGLAITVLICEVWTLAVAL